MKKAMLWFLLAMLLLTLTACGEAKKYEEAQALMKGGAYSEAYAGKGFLDREAFGSPQGTLTLSRGARRRRGRR